MIGHPYFFGGNLLDLALSTTTSRWKSCLVIRKGEDSSLSFWRLSVLAGSAVSACCFFCMRTVSTPKWRNHRNHGLWVLFWRWCAMFDFPVISSSSGGFDYTCLCNDYNKHTCGSFVLQCSLNYPFFYALDRRYWTVLLGLLPVSYPPSCPWHRHAWQNKSS